MRKHITNYHLCKLLGVFFIGLAACNHPAPSFRMGNVPVKTIIDSMSLEEKANLVVGTGMSIDIPDSVAKQLFPDGKNPFAPTDSGKANGTMVGTTQTLVPGAAGTTSELQRLGITPMVLTDGPAGLRITPARKGDSATYYCTAFPIGTLLASTWDTSVVNQVGQAMGNEVLEYGSDILLAPALNIHRNPLCGRNFEYYSEDPLVAGKITAAMVKGLQSQGIGTSVKHFAANNQETNRNTVNAIVSERALREIYLKGFEIAVEDAQPWTVMSSYNKINGTYTSESHDLLTTILRDEWGFKGFVMTDWGGGSDAIAQMAAGNDLIMPGKQKQSQDIVKAVKEGKLDVQVLNKNVERILNILLQSPRFKGYKYSNKPDLKLHAQVVRMAASEGMVLLKNTNEALPITGKNQKIAAFGNAAYEMVIGGTGSGDVNEAYRVSLTEGLKNAGYVTGESLSETYNSYIKKTRAAQPRSKNWIVSLMGGMEPVPEMAVNTGLANKCAGEYDIALITIGRNSGEGSDRTVDGDFNLTAAEKSLVKTVSDAFHAKGKKAVVVLNIAGVIEVASWRDIPDAILLAWQPGQEAGNSIADVLSGKVNPSGKLATTFPLSYKDVPSAKNFPGIELPVSKGEKKEGTFSDFMAARPAEVVYEEGIYVGYRYYTTFLVPTAYEFGYGLSYTRFVYGNFIISSPSFNDNINVFVDVKNSGSVAGKEVVQVYLGKPSGKLDQPAQVLIGFAKTKMLNPGDSQTLHFTIDKNALSSFDTETSSWIAEAGRYEVKIGASSKDIQGTLSFNLANGLVVKKAHKALAPQREIKKLRP
jgi:beta-glucosidase